MTAEERQRRGDRYAAAWLRAYVERQERIAAAADAYARACAAWVMQALPDGAGEAIGLPPLPEASLDPIGAPRPGAAASQARMGGSRKAYAEATGDPGAAAGYRPEWAVPLGRKP